MRRNKQAQAQYDFTLALRRGEIDRLKVCQVCGATGRKLHAHHDNYDEPLEVRWVCVPCHRKIHNTEYVMPSYSHNGRTIAIGIRIPFSMLQKAKVLAREENITFNQWANLAVANYLRSHTKKL